jgi:plasmid stabilization system protein ParE
MDFSLVWTEPASEDMRSISRHISRDSILAADRVIQAILRRASMLESNPYLGAVYSRSKSGRIREILSGSYRIFYRIREDAHVVDVLAVWHGSRDEPRFADSHQ